MNRNTKNAFQGLRKRVLVYSDAECFSEFEDDLVNGPAACFKNLFKAGQVDSTIQKTHHVARLILKQGIHRGHPEAGAEHAVEYRGRASPLVVAEDHKASLEADPVLDHICDILSLGSALSHHNQGVVAPFPVAGTQVFTNGVDVERRFRYDGEFSAAGNG